MRVAATSHLDALHGDRTLARALPVWISLPLILACAGASYLIVHACLQDTRAAALTAMPQPLTADGVRRVSDNHWRITCGDASVTVGRPHATASALIPADAPLNIDFAFERYLFLTAEQVQTLTQVKRLAQSPSLMLQLGLSPQVIQQLREIHAAGALSLTDDDTAALRQQFHQYLNIQTAGDLTVEEWKRLVAESSPDGNAAPALEEQIDSVAQEAARLDDVRAAAETSLVRLTAQGADHIFAAARTSAVERAARAQQLLTPEQWDQLRKLRQR